MFVDITLSELITDMNRYVPRQMVVPDARLGRQKITGDVNIANQDEMLEALRFSMPVKIKWNSNTDGLIVIQRDN